ncbi:MAG: papain-like cysteine peptidase [Bacilli bacterium]|nr:papain-like cysteine peptidase [Bacilli bacterium]
MSITSIVPFGCCCGPATLLKRNGLRNKSCFFDWLDGNLFSYIDVVNNNFEDVLNVTYLVQMFDNPSIILNKRYNFSFVHLFDRKKTFSEQIYAVQSKVSKQIKNFKECLNGDSLLLYYCRDRNEMLEIIERQQDILKFSDYYKTSFVFVFNYEPKSSFCFKYYVVPQNNTHFPFGGGVTSPFICEDLEKYLISIFDENIRKQNLKWKDPEKNLINRIKRKIYSFKKDKLIISQSSEED